MGKYSDIVNLIEQSVPDYTSLKIVPRGTPVFQDLLMTGEMRFARRTGANFAVLNPDNQFKLAATGQAGQSILTVDRIVSWIEADCLVTFNKTEMLEVMTWDEANNVIYLNSTLSAVRDLGETVNLWATPLKIHFTSNENSSQLFVRSRYALLNGDAITFPLSESLNSLKQIDVEVARFAGLDPLDTEFPFIYVLDLKENLPITLQKDISRCYLRAFPAYVSKVLRVPQLNSGQIGPFLLDYIASPLDATATYTDTFSIRTFTAVDIVVEGDSTSFKTTQRNHPIVQRPIWAENMIFWKMRRGYGGFAIPNRFRMVTTSNLNNGVYVARVSTRLVPHLSAGIRYDFKVKADTAGTFIAIPYPHPPVLVEVPVATDRVVTIQTPAGGAPIQRLDFIFKTTRDSAVVTVSDASLPVDPIVQRFQYAYVFRILGTTNFQATSVLAKPYFLSLADLKARYDDGKSYNSGFIYL